MTSTLNAEAQMVANRLRKNLKHLAKWRRQQGVSCYRLYDADIPEYAVAVDVYEGAQLCVHVQEYAPPKTVDTQRAQQRLQDALSAVREVLAVDERHLFVKVRQRQKGSDQYEKLAAGGEFFAVEEGGLAFSVNFTDYLDTGLFLDHRSTRALVRSMAAGKHFLNLFAYTGSVSVYAAAGGARSTTTVDMSNTYLAWAGRHMAANGFVGEAHEFIQADCLQWLAPAAREQRSYDLIFVDPPSFSSSKRMQATFDVQRDHVALLAASLKLLDADGVLVFSNNNRRFKFDRDGLAAVAGPWQVEEISRQTLPKDFERNPRIHNSWRIRRSV